SSPARELSLPIIAALNARPEIEYVHHASRECVPGFREIRKQCGQLQYSSRPRWHVYLRKTKDNRSDHCRGDPTGRHDSIAEPLRTRLPLRIFQHWSVDRTWHHQVSGYAGTKHLNS